MLFRRSYPRCSSWNVSCRSSLEVFCGFGLSCDPIILWEIHGPQNNALCVKYDWVKRYVWSLTPPIFCAYRLSIPPPSFFLFDRIDPVFPVICCEFELTSSPSLVYFLTVIWFSCISGMYCGSYSNDTSI